MPIPPTRTGAIGAESRRVPYLAIAGDIAIAIAKFGVAALTGSSARLSGGVHSLVATGNERLLLPGARRSRRAMDSGHPFGNARRPPSGR